MSGILELSLLFIILGAKGFTRGGLPFSSRTRLRGASGRSAGAACVLAGLAGLGFAYWGSAPVERERLWLMGQGVAVALLATFMVVGWSRFESGDDEAWEESSQSLHHSSRS